MSLTETCKYHMENWNEKTADIQSVRHVLWRVRAAIRGDWPAIIQTDTNGVFEQYADWARSILEMTGNEKE